MRAFHILCALAFIWLSGMICAGLVFATAFILCKVNGVEMVPLVRVAVSGGGFLMGVVGATMLLNESNNG